MSTGMEQDFFRQMPDRVLALAHLIPNMDGTPTIYTEKNGRGDEYATISMPSTRRRVYLGKLDKNALLLLASRVELCQKGDKGRKFSRYAPDIQQLRVQIAHVRAEAYKWAEKCGLYFSGYELRRRKDVQDGKRFEQAKSGDLLELAASLDELIPYLAHLHWIYNMSRKCQEIGIAVRLCHGKMPTHARDLQRTIGAAMAAEKATHKIHEAFQWIFAAWQKAEHAEPL